MTNEENAMTIEEGKRFSQSKLWQWQAEYFDTAGIDAWTGSVPFYITSNPYIANCYAEVVIGFILDQIQSKQNDPNQPYYVLELGTGPGKFSYYFLMRIFEKKQELNLKDIKIVYLMSDFTESNIAFWRTQPQFSEYLQEGKLDFVIFNAISDKEILLMNNKTVLNSDTLNNPITVISNYLFDSIPHDVYRINNKTLQEGRINLSIDKKYATDSDLNNIDINKVNMSMDFSNAPKNVYADPIIDTILQEYQYSLTETSFTFPIAHFSVIRNLMSISSDKLLLIVSDNGYCHLSEIEGRLKPRIATHGGAFSMMVNFHALGKFVEACGGDYWHQQVREGIKTSVFSIGTHFKELPFTRKAIKDFIYEFGPGDFFNFHKHLTKTKDKCDLRTIISHINFSRWDPKIFNLFVHKIIKEIKSTHHGLIENLLDLSRKIAKNIYSMPGAHETCFNIAQFLYSINHGKDAIFYYKKYIEHHAKDFTVMYNIGLCYVAMGEDRQALKSFKEAAEFDAFSKDVADWISWLEEKVKKQTFSDRDSRPDALCSRPTP
ncbi:MAG: hypothetical protein WB791_07050 [Waddliaceae bacterium]